MEEFELEPGEEVILHVRKHWLAMFGELLPYIFLAIIPTLFPGLINWISSLNPQSGIPFVTFNAPVFRLLFGLWWFILWIGAFNTFTRFYLNMWVITSQRIVEIHQYGFFNRQVSSFLLSRVQDVTTTVDGFFSTMIGYGTVRIETAGTDSRNFAMSNVHDPQGMRDLIMREIDLVRRGGSAAGAPVTAGMPLPDDGGL